MIGHVLVNTDEIMTYDYSYSHMAIDLVGAGNSISDVVSLEDGVVELVVSDVTSTNQGSTGTDSYGNFVKIRHSNGQKTLYAHLQYGSVSVQNGDYVSKGEKIGTMGATGNAYGVHLHFEVRNQDESRENPYEYLWGQKQIRAPSVTYVSNENDVKEEEKSPEKIEEEEPLEEKVEINEEEPETQIIYEEVEDEIKKEEIIIEEEIDSDDEYLENSSYDWYSIVDALKEINSNSAYDYRCLLAQKNDIQNYHGSARQNLEMLGLLKQGKLLNV